MSSNVSVKKSGRRPSGPDGTPPRECVICRRAIAQDDVAIEIRGVGAHVIRAAGRRRRARD
jgi:hypothetical protein